MALAKKKTEPVLDIPVTTKVKLVRDAIGGIQLMTENGELLQNVFVKQCERMEGSVACLNLEVIFLFNEKKVKNW